MTSISGPAVGLLAFAWAATCGSQALAQTTPADPTIAKVESGLQSRLQIAGEPAATWSISERMAFYKAPGVSIAVIKDGKIAWAKGYGVLEAGKPQPVDTETLFQAASISKPTAAIAALRLVEQGKLSLDAPINDALKSWKIPENAFTEKTPVTLRHVLSHGAGFTVSGFPGYAAGVPVPTVQQVLDGEKPANTPAVRVNKLPGESWRYSGGGFTVMQLAMTEAAGKDFVALTDDLILKPAGMTRSTYAQPLPEASRSNAATAHRQNGSAVAGHSHTYPELTAAGLWTTPSDLARLGLAVVSAAKGEPNAILSQDMVRQMLTKQIGTYGLGFDLANPGDGLVFHHGGSNMGFKGMFAAYADGSGGFAILTNGDQGGALMREIQTSLAVAYGWKYDAPEIRTTLAITPERAAGFVGEYVVMGSGGRPDLVLRITADGDKLWIEAPPAIAKQRFHIASEKQAFAANSPMLAYTMDSAGKAATIQMNPTDIAVRRD